MKTIKTTKRCNRCKKEYPIDNFYKMRIYYQPYCKVCYNINRVERKKITDKIDKKGTLLPDYRNAVIHLHNRDVYTKSLTIEDKQQLLREGYDFIFHK